MRILFWRLTLPLVGLLALTVATAGPIVAQNIVVLHGLNAGLAKPLTVTAAGNLNVAGVGPVDATYITQTANATLTAEQALGALATGILSSTTVTGVVASNSTSASIAALISDETGTGLMVFGTSPTFAAGIVVTTDVQLGATGDLKFGTTRSVIRSTIDGVISVLNSATSDFGRINFGSSTASFPALRRNGTGIDVRLADDSAYSTIAVSGLTLSGTLAISATAPTISSGFGTTPSIAANNGTIAFTINVGTGGTASGGTIGLPAATTGWVCSVENRTAVAANRADQRTVQTATTTTTVTVQNQTVSTGAALAWTASDILSVSCTGI